MTRKPANPDANKPANWEAMKTQKLSYRDILERLLTQDRGAKDGTPGRRFYMSRREELVWLLSSVINPRNLTTKEDRRKARIILTLMEAMGVAFFPASPHEDVMALAIVARLKQVMVELGLKREPTLDDAKEIMRAIIEASPFHQEENLIRYRDGTLKGIEDEWKHYVKGRKADPYVEGMD